MAVWYTSIPRGKGRGVLSGPAPVVSSRDGLELTDQNSVGAVQQSTHMRADPMNVYRVGGADSALIQHRYCRSRSLNAKASSLGRHRAVDHLVAVPLKY
ncbi:hypothetical protein N7510_003585 [Penicillium lagena]|uniref:uncharacterized protein n=1 Tax=Penicillium lagena TaxID=94218 RepID=UPI00253FF22B|nr:uncharacterized protein N7510_003585 [Penicillium lagena]KAJ5619601.1 hypothetical protein N7510_003585 [Penicillium lagena]